MISSSCKRLDQLQRRHAGLGQDAAEHQVLLRLDEGDLLLVAEPEDPGHDAQVVEPGGAADAQDQQARQEDQGLGEVHAVVAAAERAPPGPALAAELGADVQREPPGLAVVPAHRRRIFLALGAPQPEPAGPRQPLHQGRLVLAQHEPARAPQCPLGRGPRRRRRSVGAHLPRAVAGVPTPLVGPGSRPIQHSSAGVEIRPREP